MLSLRSDEGGLTVSCVTVPSSVRWLPGPVSPGVLGGGVDSTAGELLLDGEESVPLEGFDGG